MAVIVNEQNQLEVLWALDVQDERLVDPQLAVRGKEYRCPGCRGNLIVRQGNKRRRHFAHKSADAGGCETYVHSTAKYLLQQVIQKTQHGGRVPVIQRSCDECGQENSGDLTKFVPHFTSVQIEHRMSNILRPDVAILSETGVIFALEVRVEHPVSPDKALRFKNTPFMEILGEAVLQDPYTWVAIEHNLSLDKDFRCQKCARHNYLLLRQKQPDAKHIPTQLDLAQYDGLYKHIMWEQVRAIPNWQCPVCSRTLLEITTWSYRKNLGREDWLVPIASFPRQTTLICQSCKDADSDVKGKTTNQIPTHFHFTYEQIRQFIVPQPHAKSHILVYNKALEIYQKTLPAPDSVSERRLSEPALSWVR